MLEILALLIVQFNLSRLLLELTSNEVNSKKLNELKKTKLGVNSPKLSKALIQLGVPADYVSLLLSTGKAEKSKILGTRSAALEQGNSIYWSSCQATDPRAEGFNLDSTIVKVNQEAKFCGVTWWIWAVGNLMSVDGLGFKARAKIRAVTNKTGTIGYYVDRIYGNPNLLDLNDLIEWAGGLPILEPCSKFDHKATYQGFVPSHKYGYQDSELEGEMWFKEKKNKSLLYRAYQARRKEAGCYVTRISDLRYNPQNGEFSLISVPDTRRARLKPHKTSTEVHNYIRRTLKCTGDEIINYRIIGFLPDNKGVEYTFILGNFSWSIEYYYTGKFQVLKFASNCNIPALEEQVDYGLFTPEPEPEPEPEPTWLSTLPKVDWDRVRVNDGNDDIEDIDF